MALVFFSKEKQFCIYFSKMQSDIYLGEVVTFLYKKLYSFC